MTKNRNRLLILLALLMVGLLPIAGPSYGDRIRESSWTTQSPNIGGNSGEPDAGGGSGKSGSNSSHGASSITPGDSGAATPSPFTTAWLRWAVRIWAAINLGVGR